MTVVKGGSMTKIETVIQPGLLDALIGVLLESGVDDIVISEVREYRGELRSVGVYRGCKYAISFVPKIRLETMVHDELVNSVYATIVRITGASPDGNSSILIYKVNDRNPQSLALQGAA